MLEKMDSLVDRASGTPASPASPACSEPEPRPISAEDAQRILADAARTQERWGTDYDFDRHEGPAPPLDVILETEILPKLELTPADTEKLVAFARREQAKRDERNRQYRLREFNTRVGQRFAEVTLENYEVGLPEQRKVLDALKSYASEVKAHVKAGEGIILFGSAGTGKTHLLCAVAKVAIETGLTIGWSNGQDLFARFRQAIEEHNSESKIIQELIAPDVLIFDDLLPPGGSLTDYQATTLYRIIDARYRACKPTWATLNVADGSEAGRGMGAQTADRLRHDSLTLFCNWPTYRKAQR